MNDSWIGYGLSPMDRFLRDVSPDVADKVASSVVPDVAGRDLLLGDLPEGTVILTPKPDVHPDFAQLPSPETLAGKVGYLAGPMSGYDDYNYPAFNRATEIMAARGLRVINPASLDPPGHTPGDWTHEQYLRRDLRKVVEVDYLVVLDGWRESRGARTEVAVARGLDLPVYTYPAFEEVEFTDRVDGPSETALDEWVRALKEGGQVAPPTLFSATSTPSTATSGGEKRVVNETTGGEKGRKLARYDLLPGEALEQIAEHFGKGAAKYADRNWERGYEWSLSFAALQRHLWAFWMGEDHDPEMGSHHLAAAGFHVLALLTFVEEHPSLDDRATRT